MGGKLGRQQPLKDLAGTEIQKRKDVTYRKKKGELTFREMRLHIYRRGRGKDSSRRTWEEKELSLQK